MAKILPLTVDFSNKKDKSSWEKLIALPKRSLMSDKNSPQIPYIDGSFEMNDVNQGRRAATPPEEKPIRSGLYYVIPSEVFEDDTLDHSEKMFYGLLSGIAWNDGFCYAGNPYLAKRMKVSDRTIKNWIEKLEECGYIRRETTRVGMFWQRKIFISHSSKKSYEGKPIALRKGSPLPYSK